MKRFLGTSAIAVMCSLAFATTANGQTNEAPDTPEAQSPADVATIVVRAQKRDEDLQTVPISVTAITSEQIKAKGIQRSDDIARLAPNVTFSAGNFDATPKVFIRGVGSNEFVQNANTGVGIYIDEAFKGLATGQTFQLFDLESIEVLRGPQSTLYGKNTSGGVINFYSTLPKFKTSVGATVTVGEDGLFETEAHVNLPLSETISSRFSFSSRDRDGLFFNQFTSRDEGRKNSWAARGQLLFEPDPNVTARFKLEIGASDTDFKNARHVGVYNPAAVDDPTLLGLVIDPDTNQFLPGFSLEQSGVDFIGYRNPEASLTGSSDYPMAETIDSLGLLFTLNWDLGFAEFSSITAFEDVDRIALQDADYSPNAVFHNDWFSESELFSQEIRLTGETGRLLYQFGAYYYEDRHDNGLDLVFFECFSDPVSPCTSILPGLVLPTTTIDYDYTQKTTNFALFTQETLQLTDQLSITGGLRYTWEKRTIDAISISDVPPVVPGFPRFQGSESWENVLGKVGIDFEANDNLFLYASWAQGFKAGNWNGGAYNAINQVNDPADPETVDTFEVGLKSTWFDRRVKLNLAAFTSQVNDMQVFVFQSRVPVLQNAAEGKISGFEAELSIVPLDGLVFDLAYGYLDAKYENFIAEVTDPTDISGATFIERDLSGNRIVQTPKHSLTASLAYSTDLDDTWSINLGADYTHRSRVFFTVFNDYLQEDGYDLVNLRAGIAHVDGIEITAFVRNLTDERYYNDAAQIGLPFGMDELFEAYDIRTFGVRISGEF